MPLPHAGPREFRCRGCTLMAMLDGGPHSSTFRGERTPATPACPQCGKRSWIDPYSFTAYYAKLSSNLHWCVFGHEDASVQHLVLQPTAPLATPARDVIVIASISAGLCSEHLSAVQTTGIGLYRLPG